MSRIVAVVVLSGVLWAPSAGAEPPKAPGVGDAGIRAKALVEAIRHNDPKRAAPFFFGREAFRKVKAIKNPDRYFDYLLRVYGLDVGILREHLKAPDSLAFVSFSLGRRRSWIPRGKEGNALPYYATYRSPLVVLDGGVKTVIPVRVMITWEGQWYVTHLTRKTKNERPERRFLPRRVR